MSRIEIKHVGNIDKPFPIIEIYPGKYDYSPSDNVKKLVISDSLTFSKVRQYIDGEIIGISDASDFRYGTFSVSVYETEKPIKTIFLNKEGSVYLLINVQLYITDKTTLVALQGMVRRLL